jgi:hypothetical protein
MKNILFVAFSHTLTQSQIDGFNSQFAKPYYQEGCPLGGEEPSGFDATIVSLAQGSATNPTGYFWWDNNSGLEVTQDVDHNKHLHKGVKTSRFQFLMSNIPARADLEQVQALAKKIVGEAIKVGATHFFCVGEPTLTLWANVIASNQLGFGVQGDNVWANDFVQLRPGAGLICIQSTTERKSVETTQPDGSVLKTAVFNHVQWREMF